MGRGTVVGWYPFACVEDVLICQDELMKRSDVTAAFILTSSIAILASAQVRSKLKQHTLSFNSPLGASGDFITPPSGNNTSCRSRLYWHSHCARCFGKARSRDRRADSREKQACLNLYA
jgi:hypothetical protein